MLQLLRESNSLVRIRVFPMNPRDQIPGIWRRRYAVPRAAALVAPGLAARLPRDEEEQAARIKNLAADTELKEQAFAHARVQLGLAIATVIVALGTLLVAALGVYLNHRDTPLPRGAFIFGAPVLNRMV